MYREHTVGVVVPAYNEGRFVGEVIETIPDYVDRIYAIDDGSTDDTWDEIKRSARRVNTADNGTAERFDQRVVPIQHGSNRGVGGAIKTGYRRACDDRLDVTAVMGGDGQMRADELHLVLDPIVEDRADYVKGNRLARPETRADMPRFRLFGNRLLSVFTRVASGYWGIGDPQNGYTAISLAALDAVAIEDIYEFYGYCNDLLVKLNVEGMRVADVPRCCNYADEVSHIRYSTYIPRVSWMLLRNFCWRLRERYLREEPGLTGTSYGLGLLTAGAGAVLALVEALTAGPRSRGVTNALRGTIAGLLLFVVAAALEHRANDELSVQIDSRPIGMPEPAAEQEADRPTADDAPLEAENADPRPTDD